ncbi:hypothetical protein HanRHA438_Chr07g0289201 [Helianthus annuus]|uniref:Uncharacterized protein n=1 Tax=Helianthus annuus TaxID=4232 RepID=A0A9K3II23_HELAN|nr:hypothetical protein HanXRQr2_Chr07g0278731 [Helianthus annuus]KAJ0549040.1 hypothetical protein HanHA300_Chr07g0229021 [Helianthus annuus]KAJ0561981.1 hypothetical protein HanHA89_Chr07g0246041 [Helianthus annuus]KAJ0903485.1 hypothetical protein HanPSC8_Chr07g0270361 [Helianthus annuus]KAJ0906602.1 hypothetical protein HanRHA438_Chr07g0289201 [Helianthus annuus]
MISSRIAKVNTYPGRSFSPSTLEESHGRFSLSRTHQLPLFPYVVFFGVKFIPSLLPIKWIYSPNHFIISIITMQFYECLIYIPRMKLGIN